MSALAIISSQAFSPNKFSGLQLWMDAPDQGTILDSAGAVNQWLSKSSVTNRARQLTSPKRPTTGTRTINGLNVIDFDGVDDLMILDNQPILARVARTIIVVGLGDVPVNNIFLDLSHSPSISGEIYTVTTEIGLIIFNSDRKFANDAIDDGINAGILIFTNQAITDLTYDVSNFQAYKNGALITSTSVTLPTIIIDTRVASASIGDEGTVGGPNRLNGVIGEIIIYNRVLATLERQQIEAELFNKWDIAPFAFNPVDLGPAIWLEPDKDVTLVGSKVSVYGDQSGNSNTMNQTTDSKRPVFDATGMNGEPTLNFTNANVETMKAADSASLDLSADITLFAVMNITNDGVFKNILSKGGNDAYKFRISNANRLQTLMRTSGGTLNVRSCTVDLTEDTDIIVSVTFDADGDITFRENGVLLGAAVASGGDGTIKNNASVLDLGSSSGTSNAFNGDLATTGLYPFLMSDADHNLVGNFLADLYGLTWTDI